MGLSLFDHLYKVLPQLIELSEVLICLADLFNEGLLFFIEACLRFDE